MRIFLFLGILIASVIAWEPRISPPASQLERLATGTDLYLVCQVSEDEVDSDNVEVSWYKDGTRMTKQKIRKNGFIQASLAFVQPSISDNGDYTCRATTDDDSKEEKVSIVFYERAGFVNVNSVLHPQEGDTANISCETKGERLDEIFWQKNGFILTEADERGYKFENEDHNLIIPNFDSDRDDGNYTCNVVQFAQVYKQDISVTAYSRPSISVFHVPEGNYGLEGGHATFKCQATGKPAPTYEWFKHGESGETVELTAGDKYKIDDGLLVINYLTGSDAGDYSCLASNEMGNATQAAKLSIHRRPQIEQIDDVITELGKDVEIICSIESESDISDAYFTFNKQKYAPPEVPTPDSPDTVDEGSQEEDEESNEQTEEPTEEPDNTEQSEEGNEESENDDNRKRRSTLDENIIVEWRDKDLVLKINNVQMSHMGKYACHAENMAGTSHENTKVLIRHPPVFTNVSERVIRRKVGEDARIYCHVSSVPPAVLKIDQDGSKVYPDGVHVQLEQTGDKIHIAFNSLRDSDFGTYQCTARNSEGTAEPAVFELIKIEYPKDPDTIFCTKEIYPNYAICEVTGYGSNKGEWPTHFEVYHIDSKSEPSEDLDWDSESTITEGVFEDGNVRINGLSTSTNYYARFRAVNEAGRGELSPIIHFETTSAWSPEAVTEVDINCPDVCSVNWTAPNDRGSEITGYKLIFTEIESNDDDESEVTVAPNDEEEQESGGNEETDQAEENEENGENRETEEPRESGEVSGEEDSDDIVIEVGPDDLQVDLPQLLPLTDYKLSIIAINDEGESKPTEYFFRTTEHSGLSTLFPLPNWFVICIVITIAFFIALCIDAFCCKTRQCGILACITAHIRNRRNRIPKDIEQGTGTAENRGLLSEKQHNKK